MRMLNMIRWNISAGVLALALVAGGCYELPPEAKEQKKTDKPVTLNTKITLEGKGKITELSEVVSAVVSEDVDGVIELLDHDGRIVATIKVKGLKRHVHEDPPVKDQPVEDQPVDDQPGDDQSEEDHVDDEVHDDDEGSKG